MASLPTGNIKIITPPPFGTPQNKNLPSSTPAPVQTPAPKSSPAPKAPAQSPAYSNGLPNYTGGSQVPATTNPASVRDLANIVDAVSAAQQQKILEAKGGKQTVQQLANAVNNAKPSNSAVQLAAGVDLYSVTLQGGQQVYIRRDEIKSLNSGPYMEGAELLRYEVAGGFAEATSKLGPYINPIEYKILGKKNYENKVKFQTYMNAGLIPVTKGEVLTSVAAAGLGLVTAGAGFYISEIGVVGSKIVEYGGIALGAGYATSATLNVVTAPTFEEAGLRAGGSAREFGFFVLGGKIAEVSYGSRGGAKQEAVNEFERKIREFSANKDPIKISVVKGKDEYIYAGIKSNEDVSLSLVARQKFTQGPSGEVFGAARGSVTIISNDPLVSGSKVIPKARLNQRFETVGTFKPTEANAVFGDIAQGVYSARVGEIFNTRMFERPARTKSLRGSSGEVGIKVTYQRLRVNTDSSLIFPTGERRGESVARTQYPARNIKLTEVAGVDYRNARGKARSAGGRVSSEFGYGESSVEFVAKFIKAKPSKVDLGDFNARGNSKSGGTGLYQESLKALKSRSSSVAAVASPASGIAESSKSVFNLARRGSRSKLSSVNTFASVSRRSISSIKTSVAPSARVSDRVTRTTNTQALVIGGLDKRERNSNRFGTGSGLTNFGSGQGERKADRITAGPKSSFKNINVTRGLQKQTNRTSSRGNGINPLPINVVDFSKGRGRKGDFSYEQKKQRFKVSLPNIFKGGKSKNRYTPTLVGISQGKIKGRVPSGKKLYSGFESRRPYF